MSRTPSLLALGVAALLACPLAFGEAQTGPLELVLIMGNTHHLRDPSLSAPYADDDALLAARHLRALAPDATIRVLTSPDKETGLEGFEHLGLEAQPLTRAGLDVAVRDFSQAAFEARHTSKRLVKLFVTFAGFGEPGGALQLEDGLLEVEALISMLEQVGPDQAFALLDAYSPTRTVPGTNQIAVPPPIIPTADQLPRRPPNLGYIGGTTSIQQVNNGGGGFLTAVALSGLAGCADFNQDEIVNYYEWRQYVQMQIDTLKPFAPNLRFVSPRWDSLATIVDLHRGVPSGAVVDETFPNGAIEVWDREGESLIAQWYHHQKRRDMIRLHPGQYELTRYSDRAPRRVQGADGQVLYVANRVYPATIVPLSIGNGDMIVIDLERESREVYRVPVDREGGKFPENAEVLPMSGEEELRLISRLYRTGDLEKFEVPDAAWFLVPGLFLPAEATFRFGAEETEETASGGGQGGIFSGASFLAARMVPRRADGRWICARSFIVEYAFWRGYDVTSYDLDSHPYTHEAAFVHRLRLGPGLDQSWVGPRLGLDLRETLSYAPQFLILPSLEEIDPDAQGVQAVSLSDVIIEFSAALMVPAGDRLALGPTLGVQAAFFHNFDPKQIFLQTFLGIQLRPRVIR